MVCMNNNITELTNEVNKVTNKVDKLVLLQKLDCIIEQQAYFNELVEKIHIFAGVIAFLFSFIFIRLLMM